MQQTYQTAIEQVFKDEGGYTNESTDPGGPTNWGITIHDAREYWKSDATAEDVKNMPKSVAEDIYIKHYATPIHYSELPAGIDYAVLDYAINSGISRASKALQHILGVLEDGIIGPTTILAASKTNPIGVINSIYAQRLTYLKSLKIWKTYGHGWTIRCVNGRRLAITLAGNSSPGVSKETWLQLLINTTSKLLKKGN